MDSIILTSIFVLVLNVHTSYGQRLSCTYADHSDFGYSCYITIQNPHGFNNFTAIGGIHFAGKTDDDVQYIIRTVGSISKNVPSIICDKFLYTKIIILDKIGIKRVDENAFDSCRSLIRLWLHDNEISSLPKNIFDKLVSLEDLALSTNNFTNIAVEWFQNLTNLQFLYFHENQIEELPISAFNSLEKLHLIYLIMNKLKVIHSGSFGILPNLKQIFLSFNQIDAIDEKLIDVTAVETIDMAQNQCANVNLFDDSDSRQLMRSELKNCFDNYKVLFPESTTAASTSTMVLTSTTKTFTTTITEESTLSPGCIDGNLDERVCRLEDSNEEFEERFLLLLKENENMKKDLENQSSLIENLENQSNAFSLAIEELEYKILELSSRPCAC